jgi:hypothetical protein
MHSSTGCSENSPLHVRKTRPHKRKALTVDQLLHRVRIEETNYKSVFLQYPSRDLNNFRELTTKCSAGTLECIWSRVQYFQHLLWHSRVFIRLSKGYYHCDCLPSSSLHRMLPLQGRGIRGTGGRVCGRRFPVKHKKDPCIMSVLLHRFKVLGQGNKGRHKKMTYSYEKK